MLKPIRLVIRQQKLWLKNVTTITSFVLDSQQRSTTTRVENLRINSSEGWSNFVALIIVVRHPTTRKGNWQVERFNRTLLDMLRTLPENEKSQWKDHVCKVVHAYNCTRNGTTGYSPFFLLFGRHPRLPIDLIFQTKTPSTKQEHLQYVKQWGQAMQEAYQLAGKKINERGIKAKKTYNRWVRCSILQPGDLVLVRNLSERGGPGKLRSFL